MAIQKIVADILQGASVNKKNSDMMRLPVSGSIFLDFPKPLYDRVVKGEIAAVEFDDDVTPLSVTDTQDPSKTVELRFCRVNKVIESPLALLRKAKEFIAAADGFDQKAFEAAMSVANSITF